MFLWDFLPCKAVCDITYRYKYATDFMNDGVKVVKHLNKDS